MHLIPTPHNEGYPHCLAAMQFERATAPWDQPQQMPALNLLKSLDDLDEETEEDGDGDEVDDLEDEEDDDLDEEFEDDEDEDEDEDDDEDEDEEEEDEDGGVKPLKMA